MDTKLSLPLPGVQHGQRILLSVIDDRARTEPNSTWVSMPVDDQDLARGYKSITYGQFSNAVNHAAHWLVEHLPFAEDPFQPFAYAGPKDLRYPILAVAAGKVGRVMILPSPMITPEAQLHILAAKECTLYIRPECMAAAVDTVVQHRTSIRIVVAPDLGEMLQETHANPVIYEKSWQEGKDDPWLVFHTSGTTGHPKPITYTHRMMAIPDVAALLAGDEETHIHHYALKRWYNPLPMIHFVGMVMILSMTTFLRTVVVLGPSTPPSSEILINIFKYGHVDGALLVPIMIDQLCREPAGLQALQSLKYIHYAGAPLGAKSGEKLAPHVRVIPCIGSTEAGGYFLKLRNDAEDWDYVSFNAHAGTQFEPRLDGLHELVYVRKPECEPMQQIFLLYPDRDRFETNDLWTEHPTRKGLWRIVGRADDYVYLAHGDGLHASTLEPEIERHALVKAALIGGHGRPRPILLIELEPDAVDEVQHEKGREALLQSLGPYLAKVNAQCHVAVQLLPELVLFAKQNKPLVRTMKGSVARMKSLELYKDEIEDMYRIAEENTCRGRSF